jgi:hypothetical protein
MAQWGATAVFMLVSSSSNSSNSSRQPKVVCAHINIHMHLEYSPALTGCTAVVQSCGVVYRRSCNSTVHRASAHVCA